jgi:hypothetical protein
MQQIVDWLEKLGMSEYAPRFAENRIDFSVLRELTDQDHPPPQLQRSGAHASRQSQSRPQHHRRSPPRLRSAASAAMSR